MAHATSQPPRHIHIVGCLPRSGTTLMTELMISCFAIDGHTEHEYSIFHEFPGAYRILCTKKPNDIRYVDYPLRVNPDLYVIYMLRDPRDAIASRSHQRNEQDHKKIWGNLWHWQQHQAIANTLADHPRFITVRYEDLVRDPDQVQQALMDRMPFLTRTAAFSAYPNVARPSAASTAALGTVRPISPASIGNWRNNKPYLKAQLATYGDLSATLMELGYEQDANWLAELANVTADNSDEPEGKKPGKKTSWRSRWTLRRRQFFYRLSHTPLLGPSIRRLRAQLRRWVSDTDPV